MIHNNQCRPCNYPLLLPWHPPINPSHPRLRNGHCTLFLHNIYQPKLKFSAYSMVAFLPCSSSITIYKTFPSFLISRQSNTQRRSSRTTALKSSSKRNRRGHYSNVGSCCCWTSHTSSVACKQTIALDFCQSISWQYLMLG